MPFRSAFSPFVRHAVDVPLAAAPGVSLFRVDIDFDATLDHPAFAVLADDERAQAGRFLHREDALRHAATRAALRSALSELADVPAGAWRFERDSHGWPRLAAGASVGRLRALDFNMSHAGSHALIAIAEARRVGVDVEVRERAIDWQALASMVFGPRDANYVTSLPESRRRDAFFDAWTGKEALLKALGTGLSPVVTHFSETPVSKSHMGATRPEAGSSFGKHRHMMDAPKSLINLL